MKTTNTILLALTILLAAGCAGSGEKQTAPQVAAPKPVPVVSPAPESVPAKSEPLPATVVPAEKTAPAAVPAAPQKDAEPSVPAAKPPVAAATGGVKFRCAYWTRPTGKSAEIYFKNGKSFKKISSTPVMMFSAEREVYSGELPIEIFRKNTEPSKTGIEYEPLFSIDPQGRDEIGVILLPDAIREKLKTDALVLDQSRERFPCDTICFVNFSGRELFGSLTARSREDGNSFSRKFTVKNGEMFVSQPFPKGRTTYDLCFEAKNGEEMQVIYTSGGSFYSGSREMMFIVPRAGNVGSSASADVEFRSIKERKSPGK